MPVWAAPQLICVFPCQDNRFYTNLKQGARNLNIALFFFSGTGNTWWCSEECKKNLEKAGHETEIFSIEKLSMSRTAEVCGKADIIGFGYPVYGSDLPQPMKDFILGTLPAAPAGGRDVFVFCTQYMFSGNGARVFKEELAGRGYRTRWSEHFIMPNNVCVTVLPFPYTTDQNKINRRLKKTAKKIEKYCRIITGGGNIDRGKSCFSVFLGSLQRGPYRKYWEGLRNDISIDPELCTGCNRCVKICPSGNLLMQASRVVTEGRCVICLRCYNYCPVQAVLYMGRRHRIKRGIPYRGPVPGFMPEGLK